MINMDLLWHTPPDRARHQARHRQRTGSL